MKPERIGKPNTKSNRDAITKAMLYVGVKTQIHALRKLRGWTQAELGRRAGMCSNVISRLERSDDRLMTLRTIIRIANAFDLPLSVRFGQAQNLHPDFDAPPPPTP